MQKSGIKINNTFCFVIDHNDPEIEASLNYFSWLINTIFKISIELLTENEFVDINYYNEIHNCIRYSAIFLLSIIKGKKPKNQRFWSKLEELNNKIPILTFYKGAKVISENKIGRILFNLKFLKEKQGNLKKINIINPILQKNVSIDAINETYIKSNKSDNLDSFIFVKPLKSSENYIKLLDYENNNFGIKYGLNIFIGEKHIAIPREDYFLEFNRPVYYINILMNLLSLLPIPPLRLRLEPWPVCFRIDDFPSNCNLVEKNITVINRAQLKSLVDICKKNDIKITAMVTPAYISKDGTIKSWFQSNFVNIIDILNDLKAYLKEGIIEIGLHGYTHRILGKYTKFPLRHQLIKFFNNLFKKPFWDSEFYDRANRKEIPYSLQENAIENGKKLIIEYFGIEPKIFTPPQHMWDSNTEKALASQNIPFLSCDMCFYKYPKGHKWRKNPSLIGNFAYNNKNITITSATILLDAFSETLTLFNRIGIPFILVNHNWEPEWLSEDKLMKLIERLGYQENKKYMKMEELGDLLWNYVNSSIKMVKENNKIFLELDLKVPAKLIIDDEFFIEKIESLQGNDIIISHNFPFFDIGTYNFQITVTQKNYL